MQNLNIYEELTKSDLTQLSSEQLRAMAVRVLETQEHDRQENQLEYYKPVSDTALAVHRSTTRYLGVGGGNGASKTDTVLAELSMHATGVYPSSLPEGVRDTLKGKFRGPVAIRVVVESLTTTLENIILPKLQWWKWNGTSQPGGERGHWGWIPRHKLKGGQWTSAWQARTRSLTVQCHNPDNGQYVGDSTWQFMAHNQDWSDFASGDFHHIMHDELTTYAIWRENQARTMRVGGRMYLCMTWPDDPSIAVDWAYDEMYERGRPGPDKRENVDWFEMWSTDNANLDQVEVAKQAADWDPQIAAVRIKGQPIRFSNRVHPGFSNHNTSVMVAGEEIFYNHVVDFPVENLLPAIFLLDPHPRKPHMGLWVQVDTYDDLWVVAEVLCEGGPDDLRAQVDDIEDNLQLRVAQRLGDPNMLRSPSSSKRGVCWQDEFSEVGLRIDLGDDSDVGRARLNDYFKVDPDRRQPRIHIHPRCNTTIRQLLRYCWDDYRHVDDRAQKQLPKDKDDDFPTLLKYLMNSLPSYQNLIVGPQVLRTRKKKEKYG